MNVCKYAAGLVIALASAVTSANAQAVHIDTAIIMQSYDVSKDVYSGVISINARPCATDVFSIGLPFSGAKNAEAAREMLKEPIRKIEADINRAAEKCGK